MAIAEVLERLARLWAVPHSAIHSGQPTEFQLRCVLLSGAAIGDPGVPLPGELAEFWRGAAGARLFEDVEYGQWGLVLLSPIEAVAETDEFREDRWRHYLHGDLVIGRFLGDQNRLLIRCDPAEADFGYILVALPLDSRKNWQIVAPTLEAFFEAYARAEGAKFWEVTQPSSSETM